MILLTGATGTLGSALLAQLAETNAEVRAVAHSPGGRAQIERHGAEAVDGDFDRTDTLEAAMQGCDHLFLLSPPDPAQAERERNAVDAAGRAGVEHVVAVSVMGASPSSSVLSARWHAEIDDHLTASGLGFTILRPAGFMQSNLLPVETVKAEGKWYGMTGHGASGFVDAAHVAAVAVHVLTSAGHDGATYELTGPEAISLPQAAAQLSEVTGREVAYVDVPVAQFRANLLSFGCPTGPPTHGWRSTSRFARGTRPRSPTRSRRRRAGRPAPTGPSPRPTRTPSPIPSVRQVARARWSRVDRARVLRRGPGAADGSSVP